MAKEELNPKQIKFCEEYLIDYNATRAAKAAGYSEATATEMGYENLRKPHIQAYLDEIQSDLSKLAGVTALRNIKELEKIAYSSLHNYQSNWMSLLDWEKVSDDDKAAIAEVNYVETDGRTSVKFKLHDKLKAIESLNKMLGFNAPDKIDHTTKGRKIQATPLTNELISKLIDKL